MDLCNSSDVKVMFKSSASWLLRTAHHSWPKSHSQQVIFMDILVQRQIRELWVQEVKRKGQAQFFKIWRIIAPLPDKALGLLGSLSSLAQAQGNRERLHYLLPSKGRECLLSYFKIIGRRNCRWEHNSFQSLMNYLPIKEMSRGRGECYITLI